MKKIFVAAEIHPDAIEFLRESEEIEVFEDLYPSKERLKKIIRDMNGIIVRSKPQLPAEVLEVAEDLEVIGRAGVGLDSIDTDKAEELGIKVVNVPEGPTRSVAEHAVMLMLGAARGVGKAHHGLKTGEWKKKEIMGNELKGKKLGLVGFGRIGYETGKIAHGLGMDVSYYDVIDIDYGEEINATEVEELNALLKDSDFVSVHVPLNSGTKNLIGKEELKIMKDTSVIVNAARGGIINEDDLAIAIKNNEIKAAGMDVFVEEPPDKDNPLLGLENVVLTCHLGSTTEEAQRRTGVLTVEKVIDAL